MARFSGIKSVPVISLQVNPLIASSLAFLFFFLCVLAVDVISFRQKAQGNRNNTFCYCLDSDNGMSICFLQWLYAECLAVIWLFCNKTVVYTGLWAVYMYIPNIARSPATLDTCRPPHCHPMCASGTNSPFRIPFISFYGLDCALWCFLYVNKAHQQMNGFNNGKHTGKNIPHLFP